MTEQAALGKAGEELRCRRNGSSDGDDATVAAAI
jgi:hypothetical protein